MLTRVLLLFCSIMIAGTAASRTMPAPALDKEMLQKPCAILLHGLARTSRSMNKAAQLLQLRGYYPINMDYPSRKASIEVLSQIVIDQALSRCEASADRGVFVVTHSLGSILIRYYLEHNQIKGLRRVVMLAPPNQGSEVVDAFGELPGFGLLNGPAGKQLGTGSESVPRKLGRVEFDLGVIAGTRTMNPILSQTLPNPDDGKVSVSAARVEGMCAFLTMPVSHPMIMRNDKVLEQVLLYFEKGIFDAEGAQTLDCDYR